MGKFDLSEQDFGMKPKRPVRNGSMASNLDDTGVLTQESNVFVGVDETAGKTQNRASHGNVMKKAPMMNIRFTPENYAYMRQEAAMRGLSVTAFTNWLVDQYKADPKNVHTSGVFQDETNW